MAIAVKMPKMSDTMEEGVIADWLKKVGDKVKSGDVLADVETDKATMELENFEDGTILFLGAEKGAAIPVGGLAYIIGNEGEDISALIAQGNIAKEQSSNDAIEEAKPVAATETVAAAAAETTTVQNTVVVNNDDDRLKASPLARKIASDKGINLNGVVGSGDGGRIIKRDVETYQPMAQSTTAVAYQSGGFEDVNVTQMRKTIASRLSQSKFSAPHFYLTIGIDMDNAMAAREKINQVSPVKVSFNDLVIKAVAIALRQHPAINSSWLGDKIRFNHDINIGVAMALPDGLLVPVVRNADLKALSGIATEVKAYSAKAKDKKLQPNDWAGNTFTISNLGMMGIEEFTAIINPPDACIMAVGAIIKTPVVKNGELAVGNIMKVTLSCDHRVVDGASGAEFLQTFKGLLEEPIKMIAY